MHFCFFLQERSMFGYRILWSQQIFHPTSLLFFSVSLSLSRRVLWFLCFWNSFDSRVTINCLTAVYESKCNWIVGEFANDHVWMKKKSILLFNSIPLVCAYIFSVLATQLLGAFMNHSSCSTNNIMAEEIWRSDNSAHNIFSQLLYFSGSETRYCRQHSEAENLVQLRMQIWFWNIITFFDCDWESQWAWSYEFFHFIHRLCDHFTLALANVLNTRV